MEKLNIPLSRHNKTTRRSRRVVWTEIILILIGIFVFFCLTQIFFLKPKLQNLVPDGTQMIITINPNPSNIEIIEKLFGNMPLISDRSLTLKDLSPHIHGEMAVYIDAEGNRSIAIKTKPEYARFDLFKSLKIQTKQLNSNTILLSSSLLSVSEIKSDWSLFYLLPSLSGKYIGSLYLVDQDVPGKIFTKDSQISIKMKKGVSKKPVVKNLPKNTIAYLEFPLAAEANPYDLFASKTGLISELASQNFSELFKEIVESPGMLLLSEKGDSLGFTFFSHKTDEKEAFIAMLKAIASVHQPKQEAFKLNDGTFVTELSADPDLISIEEISFSGTKTQRVSLGSGNQLMLSEANNGFYLSNDESVLRFLIGKKDSNDQLLTVCDKNTFWLSPKKLSDFNSVFSFFSNNLFSGFLANFNEVGVVTKKYSTKINLCF